MNENIDLTKILKDCPNGWKLYSCIHGEVSFDNLESGDFPVSVKLSDCSYDNFSRCGKFTSLPQGECCLFPSRYQRDWSKFTAPWYKKDKFNPKTLKSFDKVIVKNMNGEWTCAIFSHITDCGDGYQYGCCYIICKYCIPYNDETKHLVGTSDEAPEYYRYWED